MAKFFIHRAALKAAEQRTRLTDGKFLARRRAPTISRELLKIFSQT